MKYYEMSEALETLTDKQKAGILHYMLVAISNDKNASEKFEWALNSERQDAAAKSARRTRKARGR